ncbi:hypothetical protein CYLTODRAFT_423598 [Cylindrobasidium torrendii FP15055 ss-10]|uniref:Gfd2/YDR514C-like C-terminal domain-containing protein n=1 Tax=Cylindrobasidium torrendii FP15055 ss-10 TaxID=1314674 RepID=A0A0D7B7X9_9AGAR|nr:hypothetical protein CYLTODRAFT_423598 [Cylindrobasidium torrendii FP15055 ss-10]
MADFSLVDPAGWTMSLHSIYSAYISFFQIHNIPWYDRSWGHLFANFGDFLAFSWPVITLTDAETGKADIVTRPSNLNAFIKMVKTRFGETLPIPPNISTVTPFSTAHRHVRHIADFPSFKKLHATLPAAELAALKTRIRAGDPSAIMPLWGSHSKTFLSISFTWSERNEKSCLEWGYAAMRCGVLDSQGEWPPIPDMNYRVGHYVTSEYSSKTINKVNPTYPWAYAFGDTQVIVKSHITQVVNAIISSLASPDSETNSNTLVLVTFGSSSHLLAKLEELGIKLPSNVFVLDAQAYERTLFNQGFRGEMPSRQPGMSMSLDNIIRSLLGVVGGVGGPIPIGGAMVTPHNTGNDAFLSLLAFQMLVEPDGVEIPNLSARKINTPMPMAMPPMMAPPMMPMATGLPMMGLPPPVRPSMGWRNSMPIMPDDLADEFGQIRVSTAPAGGHKGSGLGGAHATGLAATTGGAHGRAANRSPGRHLDVDSQGGPRMRTLSGNALRQGRE